MKTTKQFILIAFLSISAVVISLCVKQFIDRCNTPLSAIQCEMTGVSPTVK